MYGDVGVTVFTAAKEISSRTLLNTVFLFCFMVSCIKLLGIARFKKKVVSFSISL